MAVFVGRGIAYRTDIRLSQGCTARAVGGTAATKEAAGSSRPGSRQYGMAGCLAMSLGSDCLQAGEVMVERGRIAPHDWHAELISEVDNVCRSRPDRPGGFL